MVNHLNRRLATYLSVVRVHRHALQHDGLGVERVPHRLQLLHSPVEPAAEEDAQREAVRDEHEVGVGGEAARVDVAHQVVLEDGDAVEHVRA
jgi:hypothetical protein